MTNSDRSPEEIERSTQMFLQIQYLGLESLYNMLASVIAEIERKGGKLDLSTIPRDALASEFGRRNYKNLPSRAILKPCEGCGRELNARERRKPCPQCGHKPKRE